MFQPGQLRIGYIVKRYPRYSETFIVNEILAHESAGLDIEIFSLRPPCDRYFQDCISRVRAPVNYIPGDGVKAAAFWTAMGDTAPLAPNLWSELADARGEHVRNVSQAMALARTITATGINHLHAHFATDATSVARLAARFAGISYTFTAHAKDIFHEDLDHEVQRRKYADAAGIITVSDYNLRYLRDEFGSAATDVRRLFNGLDLREYPYAEPGERMPKIVAVGRLVEKKGFADLIEACALLAKQRVGFRCEIIGTGELENELQNLIRLRGVEDVVALVGPRAQSDVRRHIQSASLLAAPCVVGADGNRDGLPTVLLEAMALGTPCVSTPVTGIPEIIHDGETGIMVPQRDPAALADALKRLLSQPETRVHLAREARAFMETHCDIHKNAAVMRRLFQTACQAPSQTNLAALHEVR